MKYIDDPDIIVFNSVDKIITFINELKIRRNHTNDDFFVIGGSQIYNSFKSHVTKLHISLVYKNVLGDTYFNFDYSGFKLINKVNYEKFSYLLYEKKSS